MTQAKNYIGFLNDASGSMSSLSTAAVRDYNANITAVKEAATKYEQDTIVSMTEFGGDVRRIAVNSNPHVLKPLARWRASGGTPMYEALSNMIAQFEALPDYGDKNVSFTIIATTDGQATDAYKSSAVAAKIATLSREDRWTFVFRVPSGCRRYLDGLNVPAGNIQEWDTTTAGMAESTAKTTAAVESFFATRATGKSSSTVFYADASKVSAADLQKSLVKINDRVSLYVVPKEDEGVEIKPFILRHRMEYLKGAAFYQLTKTEAKVSHTKLVIIRDQNTGDMYSGEEARKLIGMPVGGNARLHPGNHGAYDIFIQSDSVNRKLVGDSGVIYWKERGVPFTEAELAKFAPKAPVAPAAPAVVQLPKVAPTNKPTPSPIPVTKKVATESVNGRTVKFFEKRSDARKAGSVKDLADFMGATIVPDRSRRWFVYL